MHRTGRGSSFLVDEKEGGPLRVLRKSYNMVVAKEEAAKKTARKEVLMLKKRSAGRRGLSTGPRLSLEKLFKEGTSLSIRGGGGGTELTTVRKLKQQDLQRIREESHPAFWGENEEKRLAFVIKKENRGKVRKRNRCTWPGGKKVKKKNDEKKLSEGKNSTTTKEKGSDCARGRRETCPSKTASPTRSPSKGRKRETCKKGCQQVLWTCVHKKNEGTRFDVERKGSPPLEILEKGDDFSEEARQRTTSSADKRFSGGGRTGGASWWNEVKLHQEALLGHSKETQNGTKEKRGRRMLD